MLSADPEHIDAGAEHADARTGPKNRLPIWTTSTIMRNRRGSERLASARQRNGDEPTPTPAGAEKSLFRSGGQEQVGFDPAASAADEGNRRSAAPRHRDGGSRAASVGPRTRRVAARRTRSEGVGGRGFHAEEVEGRICRDETPHAQVARRLL